MTTFRDDADIDPLQRKALLHATAAGQRLYRRRGFVGMSDLFMRDRSA